MDIKLVKSEIRQGLRNDYRVFIDTIDGSKYRVREFLNSKNGILTIKISKGIAQIDTNKIVAIRKMEETKHLPENVN